MRSVNRHLLAVSRFRFNTYERLACSVAGPTMDSLITIAIIKESMALRSGTLSRISSGTRRSEQTTSDVLSKRICSLDTSASSALAVH